MNKYSPFPGDTVPAMLEEGEYVLNRNAVNAIGKDNLDYLNKEVEPRYVQNGGYMNNNEDNWSVAQEQAQYKKNARALTARQSIESGEGIKGPAKLRRNTTPLDLYSMAEIPTNPEFNVDDWNGLVGGMSTNLRRYSDAYDTQQRHILDTKRNFWQNEVPLNEQEKYKIMRNDAMVRHHQEQDAAFQGAMKIRAENERHNVAQSKALKEHELKTIENSLRHEGWKKEHAKGPALPSDPEKPINPATGKRYDTIEEHDWKLRQIEEAGADAYQKTYNKRKSQIAAAKAFKKDMRGRRAEHFEKTRTPMSLRTEDASEPRIGHVATPKMPGRSRPQIVSDAQPHVEKAGHMMTNALKGYKSSRGGRYEYQTGDLVEEPVDEYGNPIPAAWLDRAGVPFGPPPAPDPHDPDNWVEKKDPHDPENWQEKPGQYPISYDEAEGGGEEQRKFRKEDDEMNRIENLMKDKVTSDSYIKERTPDIPPKIDILNKKVIPDKYQEALDSPNLKTVATGDTAPAGLVPKQPLDINRSGLSPEPNMGTVEERNPNPNISYGDDNYQKGKRTIGRASDFLNRAKSKVQGVAGRYMGTQAGRNYAAEQKLASEDPNWDTKSQAEQQQAVIDYRNANWKEYKEGKVTPETGISGGKFGVRTGSGLGAAGKDIVSGIGATAQGISDLIPKVGAGAKTVGMAGLGAVGGIGLGAKKAWDYMNKPSEGGKADYADVWSGKRKGSLMQRGRKGLGAMSMMLQDASMAQGFGGADWAGSGYNAAKSPYYEPLGQETGEDGEAASNVDLLEFQGMKGQQGGLISYMENGGEAKADSSSGLGTVDTLAMYENQIRKEQEMLAPIAKQFGVGSKQYKDALKSGRKEGFFSSPEEMQKMMKYIIQRKNAGTYNMRAMPR